MVSLLTPRALGGLRRHKPLMRLPPPPWLGEAGGEGV